MRYTVFSLSTCAGFCLFRKYDSGRMLYKDVGSALFCRRKARPVFGALCLLDFATLQHDMDQVQT